LADRKRRESYLQKVVPHKSHCEGVLEIISNNGKQLEKLFRKDSYGEAGQDGDLEAYIL
jgi:hypothetical protein